jgi:hypothetical protein
MKMKESLREMHNQFGALLQRAFRRPPPQSPSFASLPGADRNGGVK